MLFSRFPARLLSLGLLAVSVAFLSGCGKKTAKIEGTVEFDDGTPVPEGKITFHSKTQKTFDIEDGKFKGTIIPGNDIKVTVSIGSVLQMLQQLEGDVRNQEQIIQNVKSMGTEETKKGLERLEADLKEKKERLEKHKKVASKLNPALLAKVKKYENEDSSDLKEDIKGNRDDIKIVLK